MDDQDSPLKDLKLKPYVGGPIYTPRTPMLKVKWSEPKHAVIKQFEVSAGIRMRSWALPLLITFTPSLQEVAIGPFYVARERVALPF